MAAGACSQWLEVGLEHSCRSDWGVLDLNHFVVGGRCVRAESVMDSWLVFEARFWGAPLSTFEWDTTTSGGAATGAAACKDAFDPAI